MLLQKGNLFTIEADAICITTNGFVKANGRAVMGRGVAAEALRRFPGLDAQLGNLIKQRGSQVFVLLEGVGAPSVVNFPVKPTSIIYDGANVVAHMRWGLDVGAAVPGWMSKASLSLIRQSCKELVALTTQMGWKIVALPMVGCGAGELGWDQVAPILAEELSGWRFQVVIRE